MYSYMHGPENKILVLLTARVPLGTFALRFGSTADNPGIGETDFYDHSLFKHPQDLWQRRNAWELRDLLLIGEMYGARKKCIQQPEHRRKAQKFPSSSTHHSTEEGTTRIACKAAPRESRITLLPSGSP